MPVQVLNMDDQKSIYIAGDTVLFTVNFQDFNGAPTNATSIIFNLYDNSNLTVDTIVLDVVATNVAPGVYQAEYTLPFITNTADFTAEFTGIVSGMPAVQRLNFLVAFSD